MSYFVPALRFIFMERELLSSRRKTRKVGGQLNFKHHCNILTSVLGVTFYEYTPKGPAGNQVSVPSP